MAGQIELGFVAFRAGMDQATAGPPGDVSGVLNRWVRWDR